MTLLYVDAGYVVGDGDYVFDWPATPIAFPLAMPKYPDRIDWRIETQVGSSESPFSFSPQTYVWPAERWLAGLSWSILNRADAEDVEGFLLALNGKEGSFLLGDPLRTTPLGTWAGQSPLVTGASQTGKLLAIDGLTPGSTALKGDFFQLGTGASSRLYRLTQNSTASAAGQMMLNFEPQLRSSPADNAALILASPVGLFMLNTNLRAWTGQAGFESNLSVDCIEDLRGL